MVSSTTCCFSLQIFCLNFCFASSRSVLPCACRTKKLILTSNELLKLLEITTDWHTNAFAHFWKYCHGTKFGKFQNNFVHLKCIPTSSGCSIRIFPMYRYKIYNLLLFTMRTVFVQSFNLSVVRLFISSIVYCRLVFEMNFWAFAIYYYSAHFVLIVNHEYQSNWKICGLDTLTIFLFMIPWTRIFVYCFLFMVCFFSSSTYLHWVAFSHEI